MPRWFRSHAWAASTIVTDGNKRHGNRGGEQRSISVFASGRAAAAVRIATWIPADGQGDDDFAFMFEGDDVLNTDSHVKVLRLRGTS
jgi:hypothetical protein